MHISYGTARSENATKSWDIASASIYSEEQMPFSGTALALFS